MDSLTNLMNALNNFLFIGLPYIALAVFVVGSVYRYRSRGFKVSSLSSQFLEGRQLFWGTVPFHWGILTLFAGHLTAFLFPAATLAWNGHPVRLIIIEVTAFMFGITVLIGLIGLLARRFSNSRVNVVTTRMDVGIELLLLLQVITGLWIAYNFRWGSSWFASVLTPYLNSIFLLQPNIEAVSAMPWTVKLHIVGAFAIVALIPFSRLVHFLVPPYHYLWRPYQRVIWYWSRENVRNTATPWTLQRPHNN